MNKSYTLNVAGLTRELPICPINEKLSIAAFIMFSDVELTVACAKHLLQKLPDDFDCIITAESKGIPLAYEMSRQSGKKYLLARKSKKLYMKNVVETEVKSITTADIQRLYLDETDYAYIQNKRVLIADDVISTGKSLDSLETLITKAGGIVAQKAFVLAEGDSYKRNDIVYLEKLPIFLTESNTQNV